MINNDHHSGEHLKPMQPEVKNDHEHMDHGHSASMASPEAAQSFLKRFYIVSALLIPLAFFSKPAVSLLGIPSFVFRPYIEFAIASVIFYFSLVFFQHARHEIKMGQYGMMTLVSLGVGSGYLFSAISTFVPGLQAEFYLEVSTLIWILLFGHFLEAKSSSAAGDALSEVAKLLPKKAHLKLGNKTEDVNISELKENDVVVIKPGEKVPADGVIIKGKTSFNESHITGESKPVFKKEGDQVIAGAISVESSVEVKLERIGDSSTVGQIKNLIAQAKQTKPSAQRLADKAAGWLTIAAIITALITFFVWSLLVGESFVFAITLSITVLVIACPHALGLAIPTVSTIATRLAVKNGVFIKDMGKIETVKKTDIVVFDKTGTLTKGKFGVDEVYKFNDSKKDLLKIAGAIELQTTHPIGASILDYVKENKVTISPAENIKNLEGLGMQGTVDKQKYFIGSKKLMQKNNLWSKKAESSMAKIAAEGKTLVFVASESEILGLFSLADQVKSSSAATVKQLHKLGIKVAMLTGDTKQAAKPIANKLGIDTVFAQVLPQDKYKYIKRLQKKGKVVLMTGDGVNDAPALTQADAGVAIGAGTDVAVEAGDVVLTQSDPQHIVKLIVLSRKVYRKMVQNLWWALGYNILAIPAAAGLFVPLGFRLTPAIGALLMSLSSVIVVINAMTLRKAKLQV